MKRIKGLHREALSWFWATRARFLGPPVQEAEFSDEAIVQLHRRVIWLEHLPLAIAAAAGAIFSGAGGSVSNSFMPTVAQVLPVLFLAQIVELQFHARRLVGELGNEYASLVMQYMSVSARALFLTFMVGEAAALYASAKGPSTFLVDVGPGRRGPPDGRPLDELQDSRRRSTFTKAYGRTPAQFEEPAPTVKMPP